MGILRMVSYSAISRSRPGGTFESTPEGVPKFGVFFLIFFFLGFPNDVWAAVEGVWPGNVGGPYQILKVCSFPVVSMYGPAPCHAPKWVAIPLEIHDST